MTFTDFSEAYRVFSGDYVYSGGTEVHIMAPWESPWKWQDNITRLPDGLTEDEVLAHLAETDTIAVTCSDKDMIHDVWEMQSMGGNRNVWMISAAGGVVQPEGERLEAMRTIAIYLFEQTMAGKAERLGCVTLMNHNEVCGAVKQWNDQEPLVRVACRVGNKEACLREFEENSLMNALIRQGAKVWLPFNTLPTVIVNIGLYDMQRDGQGKKSRILPLTMDGPALMVEDLKHDEVIKTILNV